MGHRCIHCGECIRSCPFEAWAVDGDPLRRMKERGFPSCAVLDPSVFGQFGGQVSPARIIDAFRKTGFAEVTGMAQAVAAHERAVSHFLRSQEEKPLPAISSDCPAVVHLIQVKFPSLLENLIPVIPYYEIMAGMLKRKGLPDTKEIHYIVPCLAKARAAVEPWSEQGGFTAAILISDLYNSVKGFLGKKDWEDLDPKADIPALTPAFPGGESRNSEMKTRVIVDGIHRVSEVLELVENGLMADVPLVEAWSCPGGCLGGPLNLQNPYWARFHLETWIRDHSSPYPLPLSDSDSQEAGGYRFGPLPARGGARLDDDLKEAMKKLRRIDETVKLFPAIDCGSCGCPTCLALAEDVVQGYASEEDCIYVQRGSDELSPKERKGCPDGNIED